MSFKTFVYMPTHTWVYHIVIISAHKYSRVSTTTSIWQKINDFEEAKFLNRLFSTDVICSMETCVGVSSGTASLVDGIVAAERDYPSSVGSRGYKQSTGTSMEPLHNGNCRCQCIQPVPVFRDDLRICVDDLQGECIFSRLLRRPVPGHISYFSKHICT